MRSNCYFVGNSVTMYKRMKKHLHFLVATSLDHATENYFGPWTQNASNHACIHADMWPQKEDEPQPCHLCSRASCEQLQLHFTPLRSTDPQPCCVENSRNGVLRAPQTLCDNGLNSHARSHEVSAVNESTNLFQRERQGQSPKAPWKLCSPKALQLLSLRGARAAGGDG